MDFPALTTIPKIVAGTIDSTKDLDLTEDKGTRRWSSHEDSKSTDECVIYIDARWAVPNNS